MAEKYIPAPIDTSNIELPNDIAALMDKLAENTHEVWAKGRIESGWSFGEKRDDELKHHPCLIPYGELPESEKEYDIATSAETLKCILALGYKIVKD